LQEAVVAGRRTGATGVVSVSSVAPGSWKEPLEALSSR
jgi:hypothetical protein